MKKGFTLIELMIVVVIIGILAAIAIPNFVKIIDRAKEASVKANMHTVQVTTETMSVDAAGAYPIHADFTDDDLPGNFVNPYDSAEDGTDAIKDGSITDGAAADEGLVGYYSDATATMNGTYYSISGGGKEGKLLDLVLSPGQ